MQRGLALDRPAVDQRCDFLEATDVQLVQLGLSLAGKSGERKVRLCERADAFIDRAEGNLDEVIDRERDRTIALLLLHQAVLCDVRARVSNTLQVIDDAQGAPDAPLVQ